MLDDLYVTDIADPIWQLGESLPGLPLRKHYSSPLIVP